MSKQRWTDLLPGDVSERLGNCRNRKSDIPVLVNAKWAFMVREGKKEEGFTKEDALVSILELLDCNGQTVDLTEAEYTVLCKE